MLSLVTKVLLLLGLLRPKGVKLYASFRQKFCDFDQRKILSVFSVVTKVLRNTYLDKYLILIFDFKIF